MAACHKNLVIFFHEAFAKALLFLLMMVLLLFHYPRHSCGLLDAFRKFLTRVVSFDGLCLSSLSCIIFCHSLYTVSL